MTILRTASTRSATLPPPRGAVSELLLGHIERPVHRLRRPRIDGDALTDEDLALALYLCYELHYRGLPGVDEGWEWEPSLLEIRRTLEATLEGALLAELGPVACSTADEVRDGLLELASDRGHPSLSRYMAEVGTLDEMREFCVHRSLYQLKEADPHTWAVPRLEGRSKAALVDIQFGEYGDGHPARMHSTLFALTMTRLGLDPTYGAYLAVVPAVTLSTVNVVSMFGLHRRWRGALVGHLALFEMCSVGPMGRYRDSLHRLGVAPDAADFYQVHVEADRRHQVVALDEMVAGLLEDDPLLGGSVLWGARALELVEQRFASHVLSACAARRSSLRPLHGRRGPAAA